MHSSPILACAMLALALLAPISASAQKQAETLRIGVLAYMGKESALQHWGPHADYLNASLAPLRFEIVPLGYEGDELTKAVANRELAFVITNPGHYIELELADHVTRIATRRMIGPKGLLDRFGGTAFARAERADLSDYASLRGKKILIPSTSSLGGWQVHLREALAQGLDPRKECTLIKMDDHKKVVRAILNGEADAGFVRSDLLEQMASKDKLELGRLRIINQRREPGYDYLLSTRLYPEWPFAVVNGTDLDLAARVLEALLRLPPDSKAARAAGIHGWTIPAHYHSITDLLRESGLGPFSEKEPSFRLMLERYWPGFTSILSLIVLVLLAGLVHILRSRTALQISEALLRNNERQLRLAAGVFEHAAEGILITDDKGNILDANTAFTHLTGYRREEVVGRNPKLLQSGQHPPEFYQAMWEKLRDKGIWRGEVCNKRKNGETYIEQLTISAVRTPEGGVSQYIGIFSDITQLKKHQGELEFRAHHDALTQLPNRSLLADRLLQAQARADRNRTLLAVAYLDLDGFKRINDSFGHETGDRLLIEAGQRLLACLRAGDSVARLGGDEFVLLLTDLPSRTECENAMRRVLASIAEPYLLDGDALKISTSIGIALYPYDPADPDTLLRHADQAMYQAKQTGKNRFCIHEPEAAKAP